MFPRFIGLANAILPVLSVLDALPVKTLESFDCDAQSSLDRRLINELCR
jgi:hypothetical protein